MRARGREAVRSLLLCAATGILAAATASCGAAPPAASAASPPATAAPAPVASTPAGSPGPSPGPGHDTPESAVTGYLRAILAQNWSAACSYEEPGARSNPSYCPSSMPPDSVFHGHFSVVGAVIRGSHALVQVTGRLCIPSGTCLSNADPAAGMPAGSLSFTRAYDDSVSRQPFSPVACVKIAASWYVSFTPM